MPTASPTIAAPTHFPTGPCFDSNMGGATNLYGWSCFFYTWYGTHYCNVTTYDDDDFSGADMCCLCGGGSSTDGLSGRDGQRREVVLRVAERSRRHTSNRCDVCTQRRAQDDHRIRAHDALRGDQKTEHAHGFASNGGGRVRHRRFDEKIHHRIGGDGW